MKPTKSNHTILILALLALLSTLNLQPSTFAQSTAFSYQGRLNDNGSPATGIYDLRFAIYDSTNSPGALIAGPVTNSATSVSNGLFIATLDCGGAFNGSNYWLEIAARTNGGGAFTTLFPRQPILPVPYAIMANTASNLLGTLPAAQLSGTVPLAQLPGAVLTNNQSSVILNGAFTGNGSGLTSLNPANLSAGTAGINISGNAATATSATSAAAAVSAATATTANNFSGPLSGDVTGTQSATVVSSMGGQPAANVAAGASAANAATNANTARTIVARDDSGNFSAGTITANLAGNAALASNVVSGIAITNSFVTNSVFAGDGGGLTNLNASQLSSGVIPSAVLTVVPAASLTGILHPAQLPAAVVTNNASNVTLSGTINAVGGLVIQNLTADPPSPVTGQIWLRTDLP